MKLVFMSGTFHSLTLLVSPMHTGHLVETLCTQISKTKYNTKIR